MVTVLKRKNLVLFGVEVLLSLIAVTACMVVRFKSTSMQDVLFSHEIGPKVLLYTGILALSIFLNDLYQVQVLVDKRSLLPRLARASVVAVLIYAVVTALIPDRTQGRMVFGFSLLLTNGLFLIMYELMGNTLEGRAFLERVLVLGDGRLAQTLRQALLSGDYRQVLINDPRIEQRVIENLCLTGQGDPDGTARMNQLADVVDLVVVALEDEPWPEKSESGALKDPWRPSSGSMDGFTGRSSSGKVRLRAARVLPTYRVSKGTAPFPVDALLRGLIAMKLSDVKMLRGLDYYEQLTGGVYLGNPADPLFFSQAEFKIDKLSYLVKNIWERMLAAIIFVIAIPFLLIVPLAIWIDTGRPLLFIQPRVGRCGKVYKLYKWRSMDDKGQVTRVGRIIRKTKLDELPQLINVLRGEMSLVGPRPELPKFVDEFRAQDGYYQLRHMVRPGLTGWAQIMFPDAKAEDAMTKLSYDLYYVKHFSLVSDIVIMMETFKMIVFGGMARVAKLATSQQAVLANKPRLELISSPEQPEGTPLIRHT